MELKESARVMINEYVQDVEWDDPFWLDDVQENYPTLSAGEIELLYGEELEKKLLGMNHDNLERMYQEQIDQSPDSRNYVLLEVLEKLLA